MKCQVGHNHIQSPSIYSQLSCEKSWLPPVRQRPSHQELFFPRLCTELYFSPKSMLKESFSVWPGWPDSCCECIFSHATLHTELLLKPMFFKDTFNAFSVCPQKPIHQEKNAAALIITEKVILLNELIEMAARFFLSGTISWPPATLYVVWPNVQWKEAGA